MAFLGVTYSYFGKVSFPPKYCQCTEGCRLWRKRKMASGQRGCPREELPSPTASLPPKRKTQSYLGVKIVSRIIVWIQKHPAGVITADTRSFSEIPKLAPAAKAH